MLEVLALFQGDILALRFDGLFADLYEHDILEANPLSEGNQAVEVRPHNVAVCQFQVLDLPILKKVKAEGAVLLVHLVHDQVKLLPVTQDHVAESLSLLIGLWKLIH